MITSVTLEHFKCIAGPKSAPLAPLTLIYGPNSAGKSTLFQALLFLKQSAAGRTGLSRPVFRGPQLDLGTLQGVAHRHDLGRPVSLSIDVVEHGRSRASLGVSYAKVDQLTAEARCSVWRLAAPAVLGGEGVESGVYLKDVARITPGENRPGPDRAPWSFLSLHGMGRELTGEPDDRRLASETYPVFCSMPESVSGFDQVDVLADLRAAKRAESPDRSQEVFVLWKDDGPRFAWAAVDPATRSRWEATPESFETFEDFAGSAAAQWFVAATDIVNGALAAVRHVGPHREPVTRAPVDDRPTLDQAGGAGEHAGALLAHVPKIRDRVNELLRELGVPYLIETSRLDHPVIGSAPIVFLKNTATGTKSGFGDVGYGLSQVIPVLIELAVPDGGTLLIEQPELHLHPKLQGELADVLIEASRPGTGAQSLQILAETHSEQIILRVLRRIREGKLDLAQVQVLYAEPPDKDDVDLGDEETTGTDLIEMRIGPSGSFLTPWPEGFFDERYREYP